MKRFWVVGGEYTDTSFTHIAGGKEHRHGPFATYDEAQADWSKLAWQTVDNCNVRYRIEEEDTGGPGVRLRYWVVGGHYTDNSYCKVVGGGREDCFGPFGSHDEAKAEWSKRSWQSVDDCHARYRIIHTAKPPVP
ncbi:MAG: DUF4170 domain-containing protein [Alphaproteobacteria bacterium]